LIKLVNILKEVGLSNPKLIDVLSHNLAMVDTGKSSERIEFRKQAEEVFGIDPDNFDNDADTMRDEIDNILVNSTDSEIRKYFKDWFGAYADEIAQEHGLRI